MSYDADGFESAVKSCKTSRAAFRLAVKHMSDAFDEGYKDGHNAGYSEAEDDYGCFWENGLPDIEEELGWLRTRIMRGEMDDALKLVDEIQKKLSPNYSGDSQW